jgi:RNA polymerase sigma-70 factor, ECF subfamily
MNKPVQRSPIAAEVMADSTTWTVSSVRGSVHGLLFRTERNERNGTTDTGPLIVQGEPSEATEAEIATDLALRIHGRDRAAESAFVARYQRGLLALLRRKTGDPSLAADLCQDALRIGLEHLREGRVDDPARLAAYLYGIAGNLIIGHYRRERRRDTRTDADAVSLAPDPGAGQFAEVSREQVARCVRQLLDELPTPRDREILQQYYIDDRSKEDICFALDLDTLHFNRVLFRAKQRFRELMVRADRRRHLGIVPGGLADTAGPQGSSGHSGRASVD